MASLAPLAESTHVVPEIGAQRNMMTNVCSCWNMATNALHLLHIAGFPANMNL